VGAAILILLFENGAIEVACKQSAATDTTRHFLNVQ
jgi:hypothetical protein